MNGKLILQGTMESMRMPLPPRLMMAIVGPCIGVASGIVIGLFTLVARWILRRGGALET
jgi:hypothetical protein